jgi:hypothetical protein
VVIVHFSLGFARHTGHFTDKIRFFESGPICTSIVFGIERLQGWSILLSCCLRTLERESKRSCLQYSTGLPALEVLANEQF